ncbi:MarR family winged helix-turn-helix transcriptional regulator [Gracilibacillus alcaliphilus]|uniref:MarR family winged helix-turn-helix transcriptional regulator n=1 Tax=Gracilibacillus alcaliphilus TaxID=1401441 RepID=UPI001959C58B|nr:transcriptional regulator [Gracilibacillus alcaliphilus]MBM7678797.1 MarR family 2-MHQ and catechol resistance regulon transcriptional repressor [Gracilibacillus alcaliphilus]
MTNPLDNPDIEIELFLTLHQKTNKLTKILDSKIKIFDLNLGRLCLLYMLEVRNYEALPSELSDELTVTRSNISGLLRALEKLHYIKRTFDENDRRRIKVTMTEEGKKILAKAWPIYEEVVKDLFSSLNKGEKAQLLAKMARL